MRQIAAAIALLVVFAASAEPQELAGTFDQLRVLARSGETLTVTDSAGQTVRGKLATLSSAHLILTVSGKPREFDENEVEVIKKRGSDSLKNGALIGFAIGGVLGGLAFAGLAEGGENAAGYAIGGALVYGGIGAGIGAGIDALVEGQRVIYAGSTSRGTTVDISPILSGQRKGVLLTVRLTR